MTNQYFTNACTVGHAYPVDYFHGISSKTTAYIRNNATLNVLLGLSKRMYTRLQTVWSLPSHFRQANKGHSPRCHRRPNGPGRLADKVVQPTTESAEGCTSKTFFVALAKTNAGYCFAVNIYHSCKLKLQITIDKILPFLTMSAQSRFSALPQLRHSPNFPYMYRYAI